MAKAKEHEMLDYDDWNSRISLEAQRLGFCDGYKILYVPWATLGRTDTVFLSLNPGKPPKGADLSTLSDERGNSYEVEKDTTSSPITAQFLKLAKLLELHPSEILTGTIVPFRSNKWNDIPIDKRKAALEFGRAFWEEVFAANRPRRVICCCPEAGMVASEILGAVPEMKIKSGWGKTSLHRFRAADGALVAQFPHLSRHKLLSRSQCIAPLRTILDL